MKRLPVIVTLPLAAALSFPAGLPSAAGPAPTAGPGLTAGVDPGSALPPPPASITIGLFVPARGAEAASGEQARRGAQVAVDAANRAGGIAGQPLRLLLAPSDGPWDAATRELVRVIYDERAVAVVGALDGRTAHLAEQVIVRARGEAVFVTAWAAEPSLTAIRVPWFFRIVPDDGRQAEALAREIFATRALRRATLLVEPGFDADAAAAAFTRLAPPGAVVRQDGTAPASCGDGGADAPQAFVLFAAPRAAAGIVARLRARACGQPVFGPLSLAAPEFLDGGEGLAEGAVLAAPAGDLDSPAARLLRREFETNWGRPPTAIAAYAFDAILSLVHALRRTAGAGRSPAAAGDGDRLAAALAATAIEGATGPIRFDGRRDRDGTAAISVVSRGRLVGTGCACPADEPAFPPAGAR